MSGPPPVSSGVHGSYGPRGRRRAARRLARRPGSTTDRVAEVIRWGAFSCAVVPVVLLVCDVSRGPAIGTALGLAAVTVVCRMLLRRSERTPARLTVRQAGPYGRRHAHYCPGAHRSWRPGRD